MEFIAGEFDRWTCGPFVIARYYDGFYAYRYFKYLHGGRRDAKRLHPEDRPLKTFAEAISLCEKVSAEPLPTGVRLIDAPVMTGAPQ